MTIQLWTSIGGWFAATIATYITGVLLFTKASHTVVDSEQRKQMGNLAIIFGWIPLGIIAILLHRAWIYAIGS